MPLSELIAAVKRHPDIQRAGMILIHNGIVRATSRQGTRVSGLRVAVDTERLKTVLAKHRRRPGIVDIQVEIVSDRDLAVGDDVMLLVVAGDIRENVIAALTDTLEAIKTTVTSKTEFEIE
jgi:molybdopterin synthase catalytic subunit